MYYIALIISIFMHGTNNAEVAKTQRPQRKLKVVCYAVGVTNNKNLCVFATFALITSAIT